METISYPRSIAIPSLDHVVEDAVVLGWSELMPPTTSGVIHVEYHTGPERLLEYLKAWTSTERGYWSLICEYWKCSLWPHVPGLSFGKSFQPGDFSRSLESVMQHEDDFAKLPQQDGSIYIQAPTAGERLAAAGLMTRVFGKPDTNSIVLVAAA